MPLYYFDMCHFDIMCDHVSEKNPNINIVKTRRVYCAGGPGLEHPRVYLDMGPTSTQVVCPYCGAVFSLAKETEAS